jgi:3-oxocholest-4-en-26-oate---CoA ligase
VEEALKTHASVRDAVVVGIPHETYGEQIVAVVELVDGSSPGAVPEAELIDHVKGRLASYKAPRRVRCVDTIGRAPNGKVDYNRHRTESTDELGAAAG